MAHCMLELMLNNMKLMTAMSTLQRQTRWFKAATSNGRQAGWHLAGPLENARTSTSMLAMWTRLCVPTVNVLVSREPCKHVMLTELCNCTEAYLR